MADMLSFAGQTFRKPRLAVIAKLALPVVNTLLIIAIAYVLARAIWLLAFGASAGDFSTGSAAGSRSASAPAYVADIGRLRDSSLFEDRRVVADAPVQAVQLAPETQLNLTLHGVRRGAGPDQGAAIIQAPGTGQRFVRTGAEIIDGVTLEEVHTDYVIINRRGITESLYLREERRQGASGGSVVAPTGAPGNTSIRSAVRGGTARNIAERIDVGGLFEVEPRYDGANIVGYRFAGGNAALLQSAGLRMGDIVTAVDGEDVTDVEALETVFEALEDNERVSISIVRAGIPLNLELELP
ncbi:type II secretion system protein N [Maricaulis sp.]|uniref:type II secretion system protein N n=1 Tax=Maricaulis sp. TaxID=1486257 RepID=UPI002613D929|nr:type II secretion system protein N [Maricaulis sp.]